MDFSVKKEQKQYNQEIIDFARENLNDSEFCEKFSMDMWKKVSEFGLLGITVDEKYGVLGKAMGLRLWSLKVLDMHVKITGLFL